MKYLERSRIVVATNHDRHCMHGTLLDRSWAPLTSCMQRKSETRIYVGGKIFGMEDESSDKEVSVVDVALRCSLVLSIINRYTCVTHPTHSSVESFLRFVTRMRWQILGNHRMVAPWT